MAILGGFSMLQWLALAGYELLLFAGLFFLIGALDDVLLDLHYLWLKLSGRALTPRVNRAKLRNAPLSAPIAVLVPAWQEDRVIGATVAHMLDAWPQPQLRLYVGCYRNDPDTAMAVIRAAGGDSRLRLVIHDRMGPSSKADCLNRLYRALRADEARMGWRARSILLHDAEDMVDAAALPLIDQAMADCDFVQIPVLPEPQAGSRWIAGHYSDEFAEAHGKAMVVREALSAALPAAGVGCAFSHDALDRLALRKGRPDSPFADGSLTEDYELGLQIAEAGGRSRFLRVRGDDGQLVATRACFPNRLADAVRQKTRWVHGIAFQAWDRLGWTGRLSERWMLARDRRSPLTALVLAIAYLLLILATALWLMDAVGLVRLPPPDPAVKLILTLNLASFAWRAAWRFAFTTREYGLAEGIFAILRIPVANVISIMAGRRALLAYMRTLKGHEPVWEKTEHDTHPAFSPARRVAA